MMMDNRTTKVVTGAKEKESIINEYKRTVNSRNTIFNAYNRPSPHKIAIYNEILDYVNNDENYDNDLRVTGAGSHFFSCIFSETHGENTHIFKITKDNIKIVIIKTIDIFR